MEDVLLYPQLKEIGNKEKQAAFVHYVIDNIYLAFGKNMENSQQERDLAAKRFADKFPFCTLGDVVCFGDMVMDGSVSVDKNYLTLVTLFQAWTSYQGKRGDMIYQLEKKKEKQAREDLGQSSPEEIAAIQERISKTLGSMTNLWDEYLQSRPQGWVMHVDKNGVNQEYAEFREKRMREEGIWHDPEPTPEPQQPTQPIPQYNLPRTDTQEDIF